MSVFQNIDHKLESFANNLTAKLTKDRNNNLGILQTFEERRIDWSDGKIKKAIIIQPTFQANGVDSSIWNFINVAWCEKNGVALKPGWRLFLIEKRDFAEIEENIESLLLKSRENLRAVGIEHVL